MEKYAPNASFGSMTKAEYEAKPKFRSRPVGGCDALVASCRGDYAIAGKNATGASLSPCGDGASPLLSAGHFGVRAKIKPSYDIRGQISDLEQQIKELIADRELADIVTKKASVAAVKGTVGDVNYGDDSDLYGACGYVRKSEGTSGLTRKTNTAAKAAKAATASK